MIKSLTILGALPSAERVRKVVAPAADATNETESRLMNALRKQKFTSASSLAAYTKLDNGEVRNALTALIGRKLVIHTTENIDSSGSGYRAADFKLPAPEKSKKSGEPFRWRHLDAL